MIKNLVITFIILLSLTTLFYCQSDNSQKIYNEYCATCHGTTSDGGNSESLFNSNWKFGNERLTIKNNIKYGIDAYGMPAFEDVISDEELNELIDYLLSNKLSSTEPNSNIDDQVETFDYTVNIETITDEVDEPWAIAFISPVKILITEKPGRLRIVENNVLLEEEVKGIPQVFYNGQGGLLDVSVDPDYKNNQWIYLSYSDDKNNNSMTKIVRGKIENNSWTQEETIFEALEETYLSTHHHFGCRIVFDQDGYLYFSIGDRGKRSMAQDLTKPNGKIHRVHMDGTIPKDNPFLNNKNAVPSIFAYGSRNSQGLAIEPTTNKLWSTEHGQKGGDELNIIRPGKNYGWDIITYGRNYSGSVSTEEVKAPGTEVPILFWRPSPAVCGLDFYNHDLFNKWKGHLLVGALKFEEVRILDIEEERVIHQEILLKDHGRVRDVQVSPDGSIYVVLNGPDKIIRLTPDN